MSLTKSALRILQGILEDPIETSWHVVCCFRASGDDTCIADIELGEEDIK